MNTPKEETCTEQTTNIAASATVPEVQSAPSVAVATVPFYKNKQVLLSVLVAAILLAGAGYYTYVYKGTGDRATVATLCLKENAIFGFCYKNGVTIRATELNENIELITNVATQQGADLTDPEITGEIRKQALNILIDNALILGVSENAGHTATEEEIKAKYDELVTQVGGAEAFAKELAAAGLTEEKLMKNIRERILADKYIEAETDIENLTISDEEMAEVYKNISEGNEGVPPLEDIRPMLEAQLLSEKQQTVMQELLAKVREATNITIIE